MSGAGAAMLARPVTADVRPSLRGVDPAGLDRSFALCRAVARSRARNFYYGLKLTPEPRRSAVYAVYAWMRDGDDRVDAAGTAAEKRTALERFAASTRAALQSGQWEPAARESYWPAFAATVGSYQIDHALLWSMVDGLAEDIEPVACSTTADLERYCYRVASTVGLACVSVWGLRPGLSPADTARAPELAIRRGHAFQLTNILRDLAEDLDQSPPRVYVPADTLARHGLSPAQLRAWAQPQRCAALVRELAGVAAAHYAASADLERMIDAACTPTLWAMTRIYRGLLSVIERDPARVCVGPRVRLSSAHKGLIAAWATGRAHLARLSTSS
ncbi:MAG: phytoene/squalene synthase family protein [Isosphaera sp.]|nr:phytoene/squalene synthase family protein [Isosphaera sp.]